jgi:hypothetical protein
MSQGRWALLFDILLAYGLLRGCDGGDSEWSIFVRLHYWQFGVIFKWYYNSDF